MEGKTFEWEFTVLEIHLDTFSHVNHATYLQLFEQARWDFITDRGYGLKEIQKLKIGPVILSLNIRYMRELKLRDRVRVISKTTDYKGKIGKVRQKMINQNGEECAEIELTVGLFDLKERKLIPATPAWLNAVGIETSSV